MEQVTPGAVPTDAQQQNTTTSEPEPAPSLAPPSTTSLLSDAPTTDPIDAADLQSKQSAETGPGALPAAANVSTAPVVPPHRDTASNGPTANPPGWDAAREQVMKNMAISQSMPTQTPSGEAMNAKRGGRGGKRASFADSNLTPSKMEGETSQATPSSNGPGRPRGRGGRPRGSRARGGGRGGKRKREDGSEGESSDSEVATPVVTMTKSGRNIQKPTSFVPPPQSPTTAPGAAKRKRTYRRNPESAVCKMCLRGTSPASNMIVFCDGCNTPYHRYCHQPPIDQAVIDEVDKEWFCNPCEKERIVPVPEAEVVGFVGAPGASAEQRQKYFASLPPGMLVTLLTRATTLNADLPLFGPDFEARGNTATTTTSPSTNPGAAQTNGRHPPAPPQAQAPPPPATQVTKPYTPPQMSSYADDPRYPVPDEHPAHYVRPGQGLMRNLPPESEDMHYLVDDDRHRVFSHYHLDPNGGAAQDGQAGPGA